MQILANNFVPYSVKSYKNNYFIANHLDTIFERPYNYNVFKIIYFDERTYHIGDSISPYI